MNYNNQPVSPQNSQYQNPQYGQSAQPAQQQFPQAGYQPQTSPGQQYPTQPTHQPSQQQMQQQFQQQQQGSQSQIPMYQSQYGQPAQQQFPQAGYQPQTTPGQQYPTQPVQQYLPQQPQTAYPPSQYGQPAQQSAQQQYPQPGQQYPTQQGLSQSDYSPFLSQYQQGSQGQLVTQPPRPPSQYPVQYSQPQAATQVYASPVPQTQLGASAQQVIPVNQAYAKPAAVPARSSSLIISSGVGPNLTIPSTVTVAACPVGMNTIQSSVVSLPPHPLIPKQTGNPLFEGWLSKKGDKGIFLSWKRRFFSLVDHFLNYKETPTSPVINFIVLNQHSRVLLSSVHPAGDDDTVHKTSFLISNKKTDRIYYLSAPTTTERDQWITVLHSVISSYHINSWSLHIRIKGGHDLSPVAQANTASYCAIQVGNEKKKTKTSGKTLDPVWDETFQFDATGQTNVGLQVWHHYLIWSDVEMGSAVIPFNTQLLWGKWSDYSAPLSTKGNLQVAMMPIPTPVPGPSPTVFNDEKCYVMLEKFSWAGDMEIFDHHTNRNVFNVRQVTTFGHHLALSDDLGNQLISIDQRWSGVGVKYTLYLGERGGEILAHVTQQFSLANLKFEIEFPNIPTPPLILKGDFWGTEYSLFRTCPFEKSVATISKKFWSVNDKYGVRIAPGEDVALVMAVVVVIDKTLHDLKGRNNNMTGVGMVGTAGAVGVGTGAVLVASNSGHHHHHHHHNH